MNNKFFDVIVAKDYETKVNGQLEKKTAWNRIGRAWPSKSGESLSFELFILPNQRYVVQMSDRKQEQRVEQKQTTEQVPF